MVLFAICFNIKCHLRIKNIAGKSTRQPIRYRRKTKKRGDILFIASACAEYDNPQIAAVTTKASVAAIFDFFI